MKTDDQTTDNTGDDRDRMGFETGDLFASLSEVGGRTLGARTVEDDRGCGVEQGGGNEEEEKSVRRGVRGGERAGGKNGEEEG